VAINTQVLNNFSEQQLVDCCGPKGYECLGCNGAWPEWAMNYINNEGIALQSQYTYKGVQNSCQAVPTKKYLNSVRPWKMIDLSSLKEGVATAPVSICVDASNWSLYKSGVFSNCGTTNLNHAVVLVGYNANDEWIVRNSWGTSWGE
jgi:cathepsin L